MGLIGAGILALGIVFVGVSAAGAQMIPLFAPKGVAPESGVEYQPAPSPSFPTNASGLTYGSAADAISPGTEPDLILVVTTDGKEGYAKKADLDQADGTTAAQTLSPSDVLKWQDKRNAQGTIMVPVYDVEGKTVIGEFAVVAGDQGPTDPSTPAATPTL